MDLFDLVIIGRGNFSAGVEQSARGQWCCGKINPGYGVSGMGILSLKENCILVLMQTKENVISFER